MTSLIFAGPAFSQDEKGSVDNSGGQYLNSVDGNRDVYGLARSSSQAHDFELPENRSDWLEIADRIEKSEIDDVVAYAMLRGEKPVDIITPELTAKYRIDYEEWVLNKWSDDEPTEQRFSGDNNVEVFGLARASHMGWYASVRKINDAKIDQQVIIDMRLNRVPNYYKTPELIEKYEGLYQAYMHEPDNKDKAMVLGLFPSSGQSTDDSRALPSSDDLNEIWKSMLKEISEQRAAEQRVVE